MGIQQSGKTGVKSGSKKKDYSRHGFDPHPATSPVPGAFGAHGATPQGDMSTSEERTEEGKKTSRPRGRARNLDKAALQKLP